VIGAVIATDQVVANTLAEKVVVNVKDERKPVMDLKAIVESGDKSRIIQQADKPAKERKSERVLSLVLIH